MAVCVSIGAAAPTRSVPVAPRLGHFALGEVPQALVSRYFEQDGAMLSVRAPLRNHVSFESRDLTIRCPRGASRAP